MRRCALLWLTVTGCFYVEPINQRPSLAIRQTSAEVVHREDAVQLEAVASDPESHFVLLRWRAYLCSANEQCDVAPFVEKSGSYGSGTQADADFEFAVPRTRNDLDGNQTLPVEAIRVVLWGQDDYGAVARPEQELWIPVADRAPTLVLGKDSRYGYVLSTPVNVFAEVGDPDDWPAVPDVVWEVFTPMNQPDYTLADILDVPQESATTKTFGKTLTPKGIGDWEIRVTATDALGEATTKSVMITVGPDTPPCLRTLAPIVAPSGTALPISEPTLFQVHVVVDDLDPYPTVNDAQLGTTKFAWSIKTNSGARQALGVTGNGIGIDPASYQPGDIVEVRVEIADRNNTPIMCADGNATCSVISDNNCLQRQTWRVEVR